MNRLLRLFQVAPYMEPIKDPAVVDTNFKTWRWRIFYSMFVGYAFYYFTRKSFTFAMPGMVHDLGYDKAQVGILSSILFVSYGISKFTSGIFADRCNPRYFMGIGLILTGIFNICFGLSSSMVFFALFWGLNGWFQGFGWPPCARLLTHWYSHSERGTWWSFWNVSHNVGGALIPLVAASCAAYFGWRYAMFAPGFICIGVGFFLINRLRDTPQSLGLPTVEEYRNDYAGSTVVKGQKEKELTTKEALVDHVLKNPYIWLLSFAYFFIYVVRTAFNDWTVLYLIEAKQYQQIEASLAVTIFEVGGFFGSLFAGWFSDRFTSGKRGPVNVLFSFGLIGASSLLFFVPPGEQLLDTVAMFLIGFLVFGPQMLIGLAAAELAHKKAAATATGFAGFFAYIGAASAGLPLGKVADTWGWEGFFMATAGCCVMATLLLLPTWGVSVRKAQPLQTKTA